MSDDPGRAEAMDALYLDYSRVPVLAELAAGRDPVRGTGPLASPCVVVGEAPGAEEDRQGRPFAGPSGQLLAELFRRAGLPWRACYLTNVVCWRPPGNRTPYNFQVQASQARLDAEVALVDPVMVVAAGSTAWRALTRGGLGDFEAAKLRWHDLDGRRLLCVPHPACLLRLKAAERAQWEQATVAALSQALPARAAS
jgi:uracil-DNA glycosylase family 4